MNQNEIADELMKWLPLFKEGKQLQAHDKTTICNIGDVEMLCLCVQNGDKITIKPNTEKDKKRAKAYSNIRRYYLSEGHGSYESEKLADALFNGDVPHVKVDV